MIYIIKPILLVMARECNIDARGKFVRLVGGSVSVLAGIIAMLLIVAGILPENIFTIGSVIGMFAGGALGIYEGKSGWCVARAMGIRTPI
ncbi:MAG TPA: hypothetical protein D7H99_05665 [Candidatus Poseidoniales archaeon]|nr:MAG TPA: hypothetical protein D7H99_05665 [Candidatus Poseidoniales archaeon]|tara:strand:- start:1384 stop:1653 length:270 start_codon:yes stop_codon:yes gene_type:complete